MFNLFKKTDSRSHAEIIAKQAKIETVYDQGKINGFFIIIQRDANTFISKIKDPDTISTFVYVIEERIKNKDYDDPASRLIGDYGFTKDTSREDNVSKVRRIVSENNYIPIFHWQPPA